MKNLQQPCFVIDRLWHNSAVVQFLMRIYKQTGKVVVYEALTADTAIPLRHTCVGLGHIDMAIDT